MIYSHSSAPQKMVPHQSEGNKACGLPSARGGKPDLVMQVKMGNAHMQCYVCQDRGYQVWGAPL